MDSSRLGAAADRSGGGGDLTVDIVISNHNYAEFLRDAIDSACGQTHPDVNVIVVDDGSTDRSREILEAYGGQVEVVLKENGGQASALNAGMERGRGECVIFLDADDQLMPHAAERVAAAFAGDRGLSKLQFRMSFIDASGRPTGAAIPSGHLQAPTGDLRLAELAFPFDLPWLPGGGSAFRSDAVRRILPIPEQDYPRQGADWYLVHLTALLGNAAWLDEACARYRVHGRNGYLQGSRLDLAHVRDSITYADATSRALAELADELGLDHAEPILSFSDLANRLISLRLEPRLHPRRDDHVGRLVADSVRAVGRRFDVSWPVKLGMVMWALAVAVAPRPVVRRLAELLLLPEGRRTWLNRLLGRLRRSSVDRPPEGNR